MKSPQRAPRIVSAGAEAPPVARPGPAACNRRMKRRQTALPGLVTFRNMRLELPCTIADLSGTGARLGFAPSSLSTIGDLEHLPSEMMLAFRADRMEVPCEVRWRLPRSLGVRFLGPAVPFTAHRR